jgi:prepilin-type processing-associated H-X9-DG protein
MYTNDNDNRLPQDGYRSQGRDIGWEEAVLPYIKNDKIYYCPMQFYDRRGEWVGRDMRSLPFGYGANRTYLITSFPTPTVLVSDVKNPEATILLGDQSEFARGIYSPIAGRGVRMKPPCNVPPRHDEWGTPPGQGKRQKGGANFVFADGHVKWMKAGASWSRDDSMWDLK